jgi:integrase
MPKLAKELSPIEVSRIHNKGLNFVGVIPGLGLQVKGNARSWVLRTRIAGKTRDIGLGGFPAVTLAQARESARAMRVKVTQGIDPIQERRERQISLRAARGKLITFSEAMDRFLEDRGAEWRNSKHKQQWENTLTTYAVPTLGALHVKDIGLAHILNVLRPIWKTKTETASRLRGRIENILDWAKVHGYRETENPARWKGNLDKVLSAPTKTKVVKHHPALPYAGIGSFMEALTARPGIAAQALQYCILTAGRSGEVRGATWREIDLRKAEWTIPAERMKAGKEHRVSLSPRALEILQQLAIGHADEIIFKAPRGGMLSDMTLGAVLKRMDVRVTVHGFRSTFRDWAGETTGFSREVIEHALAHQLKDKAEAAYARGTLMQKRQKLMDAWGSFCAQPNAAEAQLLQIKC